MTSRRSTLQAGRVRSRKAQDASRTHLKRPYQPSLFQSNVLEVTVLSEEIAHSLGLLGICSELSAVVETAVSDCRDVFLEIEKTAVRNHHKVVAAFVSNRVSDSDLLGTTGYGYGDSGREKLDAIFAQVFGGEDALVRAQFASGTHALAIALSALLLPGHTLLFVGGPPYETLRTVIGIDNGNATGNLKSRGVMYDEVPFSAEGTIDEDKLVAKLVQSPRVCMIQRSRGYSLRPSLSIADLRRLCTIIKQHSPDSVILIDNCYGEFVESREPLEVGADVTVGSLIKNPGGGLAPSGGYVVGKSWIVEETASRLIAPGIGREVGPTHGTNRDYLRGFFLAPSVVAEALKGAVVSARIAEMLGFESIPDYCGTRSDIVQVIRLKSSEQLVSFCKGIQSAGPVNSAFAPEPGQMPGYEDQVIMASPSFVQGSSIEVSCDGPIRPPYCAFLQGGMYWHHTVTNVAAGFQRMIDDRNLRI